MLRSSTWGLDGPYREIPANGIILAGFAGYTDLLGWSDRRPVAPAEPYTDLVSPWYNASAIIAALIGRKRSGAGCELDISQLESALSFVAPELARASSGSGAVRHGPLSCDPYPSGVFRSRGDDEWCAMSIETEAQWKSACALVPGLSGCERLSPEELMRNQPILFSSLAAFFRDRSAVEAARALTGAGVPAAAVARPEDLVGDAQLAYRRHFAELPHPALQSFAYERSSFRYSNCEVTPSRSPLFGEHTRETLEMLGYSEEEIAGLQAEGALS
jgi:benzylsuccinate CoA-transferase BbsF subunit